MARSSGRAFSPEARSSWRSSLPTAPGQSVACSRSRARRRTAAASSDAPVDRARSRETASRSGPRRGPSTSRSGSGPRERGGFGSSWVDRNRGGRDPRGRGLTVQYAAGMEIERRNAGFPSISRPSRLQGVNRGRARSPSPAATARGPVFGDRGGSRYRDSTPSFGEPAWPAGIPSSPRPVRRRHGSRW